MTTPNHDAAHVSGDRFAGDISVASRSERASLIAAGEMLYGFESRTRYVLCEGTTRGQAKARVDHEECQPFTFLRCRRVYLHYREVSEDEAGDYWMDDWTPGWKYWVGCKASDDGAVAWWEVTWPRLP